VDWIGLAQDRDRCSCEFGIEPSGNYRVASQLVASRVVLGSIEL
jgi:hypothetical protein